MKFLVDFDRPHYLIRVLTLSLPPVLVHYLLVVNLPLPLIWGVIEVVVEIEIKVMGAKAVEVVTKGAMVVNKGVVLVNKGVMVEDVVFVSALIVMVRFIQ